MKKRFLIIGYQTLKYVGILIMSLFLLYGFFTLWDMYRTSSSAYPSYDLLKYRPNIEEDEPPYLDELIQINPDTAAWLTIYGTNIDYPVMQGETDMEYINKKATGEYSASGSIFLSVVNKKDFSDKYNIVYGHHMRNGAMFGDLDRFKDKDYFYNKGNCRYKTDEGVLIMEEKVYNLHVMALVETDSYDKVFYNIYQSNNDFQKCLSYIKENAKYYRDVGETTKVLAMSTCDDERITDGRTILVCQMEIRTDPLPTREAEPLTPHRKAVGHPMAGAYWGLCNLFVLLMTLYTLFPVITILKNRKNREKREITDLTEGVILGRIAMLAICIAAITLFYMTEDPHKQFQLVDKYTPTQLALFGGMIFVRFRMEGVSMFARKNKIKKQEQQDD